MWQKKQGERTLKIQCSEAYQDLDGWDNWRAFHLFYHGPLALVLQHFAQKAVGGLLAEGLIDSFFFVRYFLGGPHIRLRIHPRENSAREAVERLTDGAVYFFERFSSTRSLEPEAIRQQNLSILATAPEESDDRVYPDNTFIAFSFHPETERYGGPNLLAKSLDFFALSSALSLSFVATYAEEPRSRQLSAISRLLAVQAWGLARDPKDLEILLASRASFTSNDSLILQRGDEAFDRQPEIYCALLRQGLGTILCGKEVPWFGVAARRLGSELREANTLIQQSISLSQMHMTANRLGLKPQEEVYLGRILWRAARELAASNCGFWRELCDTLRPEETRSTLKDLFPVAFQETFSESFRRANACNEQRLAIGSQ